MSARVKAIADVSDMDAQVVRAQAAGAKSIVPPAEMFRGDRFGTIANDAGQSFRHEP